MPGGSAKKAMEEEEERERTRVDREIEEERKRAREEERRKEGHATSARARETPTAQLARSLKPRPKSWFRRKLSDRREPLYERSWIV